jgi:hypothetical protein
VRRIESFAFAPAMIQISSPSVRARSLPASLGDSSFISSSANPPHRLGISTASPSIVNGSLLGLSNKRHADFAGMLGGLASLQRAGTTIVNGRATGATDFQKAQPTESSIPRSSVGFGMWDLGFGIWDFGSANNASGGLGGFSGAACIGSRSESVFCPRIICHLATARDQPRTHRRQQQLPRTCPRSTHLFFQSALALRLDINGTNCLRGFGLSSLGVSRECVPLYTVQRAEDT